MEKNRKFCCIESMLMVKVLGKNPLYLLDMAHSFRVIMHSVSGQKSSRNAKIVIELLKYSVIILNN